MRRVDPGYRPAVTSTAGPAPDSAPDQDAVHYLVTLLLFGVAAVVLYRTGRALFDSQLPFPENVTTVVNGALFVVIVMEVLRTVVAHFEHTGFQLQPFLIIGIVIAARTKPPARCVPPCSNSASTPASSWAWPPPWS